MSVRDHGLDAIRKSAEQVVPSDNSEHYLKTKIIDAIEGSFSPTGLKTDFVTTTLDVSTTAIPLPATALTARNSIIIYNLDATSTLFIGKSTVTADIVNGTTSGWQILPGSYFSTDVTDAITIYGRVSTGSIKVQVLEVS